MTTRPLPWRAWAGLAIMLISEAAMLAGVQPFYSWHTPIAWSGYVLLVDGLVWKRRGSSWMSDSRAELAFLACASVPLWVVFELYNKYTLHNWYYLGLPESLPVRYFGYAWSFATISIAIFQTGELVGSFRRQPARENVGSPPALYPSPASLPPQPLTPGAIASMLAGAFMLLLPILYPSTYLAAPVWLGFIFLLDPINGRAGSESVLGDLRAGRRDRLVNLALSGLACGLLWEFWNYWAGTKWKYNVPILPEVKLFEMPILGYGGFPPFAVECFVMYVAVRRWLWRGAARPISV
ncbi:MAG TPA: hypothetical protein VD833_17525 [Vicinamibacterales bacterium]|nr:hypothetical protein [Vicinamibacterales bacterium]